MGKSRIMALKQAKANREKMKAAKWMAYTTSMLEIKYGEIKIDGIAPMTQNTYETPKMHSYRIIYDGARVAKFRTMSNLAIMKKRIKDMGGYECARIVEIDERDVNIAV